MLHTMMLSHKNKPLGMQSFLGHVNVIALNFYMIVAVSGTAIFLSLELFGPFNEVVSSIASISGSHILYIYSK